MRTNRLASLVFAFARFLLLAAPLLGQDALLPAPKLREAEQLAKILGLDSRIEELRGSRAAASANGLPTTDELILRQRLLEQIERSSLDVDSVLAELSSERNRLGDLLTTLQERRDQTVGRLNAAALLAGSGLSAAVGATQFHFWSTRTQDVGDALTIGSSAAATALSILAVRKQSGPSASVRETPNMLAPLLGADPVLNAYYPLPVMRYLEAIPPDTDPKEGTRLDRLKASWAATGRLENSPDPDHARKLRAVTTSNDPAVKVKIQDLTDRIAMLGDVMGTVSLMKRDLSVLTRMAFEP